MKARSEYEDIVHAIRRGGIDALVMSGERGEEVVVLQGSEHPYRVLVESFNDGAATLDAAGTILYLNDRFAEIVGQPRKKLLGTRLLDHIPWRGRDDLKRMIRKHTRGEITLQTEGDWQRTIRFTCGPMKSTHGHNICLIATELTDLVKVTEALKASERSLRELSTRLLQLQDDERRHIARDLHDITGQSLAVQGMMLSSLLKRESGLNDEARKTLVECTDLNKKVTDEVRTLSYLLHPPLLDEMGLGSAIKWYIAGFETRSGVSVSVEIEPKFPRLPPDAEIALFRIVQESLSNVHRYSGSTKAYLRLAKKSDEIVLEIGDYGKGMRADILNPKPGSAAKLGVGIQGMQERVRQLLGRLEITSQENAGTVVTAILPFHQRIKAEQAGPVPANGAARKSTQKAAKAAS